MCSVAREKRTNVFMRVAEPSVQKAVGETDAVAVMGALRHKKDNFK